MKNELFSVAIRLCDAGLSEWMRIPRAITVAGRPGVVTTSGHALLMIWDEIGADAMSDPPIPKHIFDRLPGLLTDAREDTDEESLRDIFEWLGPAGCDACKGAPEGPCKECDGSGTVPHRCDCEHCQYTGTELCWACGGDRRVPCSCDRLEPVMFYGLPFDARLLRSALPSLDEAVHIDWAPASVGHVRLRGDGWTAVLMSIRHEFDGPFSSFSATERVRVAASPEAP